jgi:hypothetical protein
MQQLILGLRHYNTSAASREPLLQLMIASLKASGCTIIFASPATQAPFILTFETADGARMGIVAYAFYANAKVTKGRPVDEHRFQAKYGSNDKSLHHFWQDPLGLFTTLFLGISPEDDIIVSLDAVFHSPLYFYSSYEFKRSHVSSINAGSWSCWERDHRGSRTDRRLQSGVVSHDASDVRSGIEVVVGVKGSRFLDLIRFERAAMGLDQGNRQLLCEQMFNHKVPEVLDIAPSITIHPLLNEMSVSSDELMEIIAQARRLKMAVRGWVAEEHLRRFLSSVDGVTECVRLDDEGSPDIRLRWRDNPPIFVECKNVLRQRNAAGLPRIDFQRTRAAKGNPCSRYYDSTDFDVVAACLHAVTENWEFRFRRTADLNPHKNCDGKISSNLLVDAGWTSNLLHALSGPFAS